MNIGNNIADLDSIKENYHKLKGIWGELVEKAKQFSYKDLFAQENDTKLTIINTDVKICCRFTYGKYLA